MAVSINWGSLSVIRAVLFSHLGSIFGLPDFWKLPYVESTCGWSPDLKEYTSQPVPTSLLYLPPQALALAWKASGVWFWATFNHSWSTLGYSGLFFWRFPGARLVQQGVVTVTRNPAAALPRLGMRRQARPRPKAIRASSLPKRLWWLLGSNCAWQSHPRCFDRRTQWPYYAILYHSILYYTLAILILTYITLSYTILYFARLYYTILYYTILYYTMLCYAMLCYAMLCYAMLCYAILY